MRRITALLSAVLLVVMSMPLSPASASTMVPQPPIPAGNGPKGIAIGDVNNDGRNDVVVTNFRSHDVMVYWQQAGGGALHTTPDETIALPVYSNPASVRVCDFTSDGENDILVGDSWHQMVHIYSRMFGQWHRAYSIPMFRWGTMPGGPFSNPFDMAIGDATLDGYVDMLVPKYYVTELSLDGDTQLFEGDNGGFRFESQSGPLTDFDHNSVTAVPGNGTFIPGYVITSSDQDYVNVTQNRGTDWRYRFLGDGLQSVSAYSARYGLAASVYGGLKFTENGGHDWTAIDIAGDPSLTAVDALITGFGMAVGYRGAAVLPINGVWQSIENTQVAENLYGVAAASPGSGYAVGAGGTLALIAKDADQHWAVTRLVSGVGVDLYAIDTAGGRTVAVGEGGTILRSSGASFTVSPSGTAETLRAVDMLGAVGFAVGDAGTILRTDDGGSTWAPRASGTSEDLRGVSFVSSQEGWAVGSNDTILHTTDGGAVWTEQGANLVGGGYSFNPGFVGGNVNPYAAAIDDFNDDGKTDLGILGYRSGQVMPIYATGGNFPFNFGYILVPDVQPAIAEQGIAMAVGDLNSDGQNDVAGLSYTSGEDGAGMIRVTLQNSISWLAADPTQELETGIGPIDLELGDVTGDGRADAVVTNSYNSGPSFRTTGTVGIFVQTPEGQLEPMREFDVGRQPYQLAIGDVDSDGHNEIVVTNEVSDAIQVLHYGLPLAPKVSSVTHPDTDTYYRATSGLFQFAEPPDFDGVEGFYYVVDRNPNTVPTALSRWTTERNLAVNFQQFAGSALPTAVQGDWYIHAVSRDKMGRVGDQASHFRVRIDPVAPTTPTLNAGTSAWVEATSRDIDWSASTDTLSGVDLYWVYLQEPGKTTSSLVATTTETKLSLDNLKEGSSVVSVKVSDKAGNLTNPVTATLNVDKGAPTVAITAPAANALLAGGMYTFLATASDTAGLRSVAFYIDGKLAYNDTDPKVWGVTLKMAPYGTGSHTLNVVATDMFGHQASQSRAFRVDATSPAISSVSDYPDPFYPVKRDGYKDYSTVKFTTSEAGTAFLQVYAANGKLWREIKLSKSAGVNSIAWDGKGSSGTVGLGTFTYRVVVRDAAGNIGASAKYPVTIRNYEVVRVAPNKVRIIPR